MTYCSLGVEAISWKDIYINARRIQTRSSALLRGEYVCEWGGVTACEGGRE
jgi:hypothetical protein